MMSERARPPSKVQEALQNTGVGDRPVQQTSAVPPGFSTHTSAPDQNVLPETEAVDTEQETLGPVDAFIDISPPVGVVFMHIFMHGPDACSVLLSSDAEGELLNAEGLPRPQIRPLGEIVRANSDFNQPLRDILNYMREFSRSERTIRPHLRQVREQFADQVYLLICDYTDFEIPWEMFSLNIREGEYLGTVFTTARWQRVIDEDTLADLRVDVKFDECMGGVVSYVNRAELAGSREEVDWLHTLNAHIYDEIHAFRSHLEQDAVGFGLVYIAGHGMFGDDMSQVSLGSNRKGPQQLRLLDISAWQLNLLQASRGIVFLNACHSGRLRIFDNPSYRKGFAESFLWQGARGVIGTLGGVGDRHAARMAHKLLKSCYQNSDKSVAMLLRELRQEAVERIKDSPKDEDWLHFIYTFMYVYYGNPMTVLRLTKREG